MAKNAITDYDTDPANNTDVGGIGTQGNNIPSNFDNSQREIMSHLADMNAGTSPLHDTFAVADPDDLTKKVRIDAGNVTAGQTRVITVPDKDVLLPDAKDNGLLTGFRNKIINGNFDFWQRATSQTSSGYGSADRWSNINVGSTKTASRQAFSVGQTDVPGNPKYFMRHVVTSVAGSGNYAIAIQKIEDLRQFAGQTVTVTFWAKADSTKDICNEFYRYYGTGGSPTAAATGLGVTTQNLTTSWQKFSYTVDIPSDAGVTYGTDDNSHLEILFWFDAGSTHDPRTNSLGQQSGTFDIARVSVVLGDATQEADPTSPRHPSIEKFLCERYYRLNPSLQGSMNQSNTQFICHSFIEGMRTNSPSYSVINASGTLHHPGSAFRDISSISSLSDYYITIVPSANFGANVSGQVKQGSIAAIDEI